MSNLPMVRCEGVRQEAGDIKVFTLRMQNAPAALTKTVRPGGHVAVSCPGAAGLEQPRLYSVTRREGDGLFEIAVKRSGRHGLSDHLHRRFRQGSALRLHYAAGDISVESMLGYRSVAMLAGGIGVTVPIALIRGLARLSRNGLPVPDVVMVLCSASVADTPFLHELLALDLTTSWFTLQVFVTRETVRADGHFRPGRPDLTSLQRLARPQLAVICGSHAFAQSWRDSLGSCWPDTALMVESFSAPLAPAIPVPVPGTGALRLRINDSDEVLEVAPGKSLLEMLESSRIPIRSQCRSGICGSCRVRISGGECRFEADFCIAEKDRRCGNVLACCTFPIAGEISIHLDPRHPDT